MIDPKVCKHDFSNWWTDSIPNEIKRHCKRCKTIETFSSLEKRCSKHKWSDPYRGRDGESTSDQDQYLAEKCLHCGSIKKMYHLTFGWKDGIIKSNREVDSTCFTICQYWHRVKSLLNSMNINTRES